MISHSFGIEVACAGDDEKMIVAVEGKVNSQLVSDFIRKTYKLHPRSFSIIELEQLPRLHNGKVDYTTLKEL